MAPTELKEFKSGQRQGVHDYLNGPHQRFKLPICFFSKGYIQGYDLAGAEDRHQRKNKEY